MKKTVGFRRNIYLDWLNALASFRQQSADLSELRQQIDPIVAQQVASTENRAVAINILLNIWVNSAKQEPALHAAALELYQQSQTSTDHLWLHYGLTLLAYDLFRQGVLLIGQLSRQQDSFTTAEYKKRVYATLGQHGGLDKASERILFSLRNWGILLPGVERSSYRPQLRSLGASSQALEAWLLAVALCAHPAAEIAFADLLRLPELFPFRFTITVDTLRQSPWFAVSRQGAGWDMVRMKEALSV